MRHWQKFLAVFFFGMQFLLNSCHGEAVLAWFLRRQTICVKCLSCFFMFHCCLLHLCLCRSILSITSIIDQTRPALCSTIKIGLWCTSRDLYDTQHQDGKLFYTQCQPSFIASCQCDVSSLHGGECTLNNRCSNQIIQSVFQSLLFSLEANNSVFSNSNSACCSTGAPSNVLPTQNEKGVGNNFFRKSSGTSLSDFPLTRLEIRITSFIYVSTSVASVSKSSASCDGQSSSHSTCAIK